MEYFHRKSKIEAIVEGKPAKNITQDHFEAIAHKLRVFKMIVWFIFELVNKLDQLLKQGVNLLIRIIIIHKPHSFVDKEDISVGTFKLKIRNKKIVINLYTFAL